MSLLAACGGSSSTTTAKGTCSIPDPTATYRNKMKYDLGFWWQGTMVVGLVSNDNKPVNVPLEKVTDEVNSILVNWPAPTIHEALKVRDVHLLKSNQSTTATAIFQLLWNNQSSNDDALLKAAIDCINASSPVARQTPISEANTVIAGASPDWSMNGDPAGGGFGGGMPDGNPTVVSHPLEHAPLLPDNTSTGKTVYILDTAPLPAAGHQNTPLGSGDSQQYPVLGSGSPNCGNSCSLLDDLQQGTPVRLRDQMMPDEFAYICAYDGPHTPPCKTGRQGAELQNTTLRTHGAFVSAIIHHRAPAAQLVLVRVLNDYGVDDLETLLQALYDIDQVTSDPAKVIVNLSLAVQPPPQCLIQLWNDGYDTIVNTQDPGRPVQMTKCNASSALTTDDQHLYQNRLVLPLGQVIAYLVDRGYTIAAAAGNESGDGQHAGADMPAAFCGVNAVAARAVAVISASPGDWQFSGNSDTLAAFSNQPYIPNAQPVKSGSSVIHQACIQVSTAPITDGDMKTGGKFDLASIDLNHAFAALGVGICSLDLPDLNAASGPALLWAGSSFATAFVSGNLARGQATWDESQPCQPGP